MHKGNTIVRSPEELPLILGASDVANILGISRAKAYQLFHRLDFPTLYWALRYNNGGKSNRPFSRNTYGK